MDGSDTESILPSSKTSTQENVNRYHLELKFMNKETNQEISALLKQLSEDKLRKVRDFVAWVAEERPEKELTNRFSRFAGILSTEEVNHIKKTIEEEEQASLFGYMKDSVVINEDILEPIGDKWEVDG